MSKTSFSFNMHAAKQVRFSKHTSQMRPPNDDEIFQLRNFESHARSCCYCGYPRERAYWSLPLCSYGRFLAVRIDRRIIMHRSQFISTRSTSDVRHVVEIPRYLCCCRELIETMSSFIEYMPYTPKVSAQWKTQQNVDRSDWTWGHTVKKVVRYYYKT
jgi:hypothetical protein